MSEDEETLHNRSSAVERMVAILAELEKAPAGVPLKVIAERTGVTRSTVYRIMNSLVAHGMVRQVQGARFILGSRLLSLANGVLSPLIDRVIAERAQSRLNRLAATLGESCMVSVYNRSLVQVVAAASGSKPYALHAAVGQSLPIHAGAGSKILLANLPTEEVERILSGELKRFTTMTHVEPDALRAELALVRSRGWSRDGGEFAIQVNAYGAPIIDSSGRVVAAISVPFLAGRDAAYEERVRIVAITTATAIGASLR
ncbi:IclR family transcriptional regulator [Kaistia sp. 32K]|uniref:IclR family transcriptional regulator n=1 Tax=Kaistia sp. 32K TaxID=2795690 RepID=UPI001916138C|nr:IclR family transcriptional regulator [Kaistia sp. 32K]BCP55256.1 IclR family transcriptional regulator [Kaistia sp. 32K]